MERNYLSRSIRVQQKTRPEEFTVADYHDARAFETVLDIVGDQHGFPTDGHSHPNEHDLQVSLNHLGLFLDTHTENTIVELLSVTQNVCFKLSRGTIVGMSETERKSYDPEYDRENTPQLKPFFQQLKYYVSRYIVESFDSHRHNKAFPKSNNQYYADAIAQCKNLLEDVFSEVQKIYQHHVPAYDVLFERFDELHREDDSNLEVYLGRDGIHAFHGRIGQIAARGDVELEVDELDAPSPERIVYVVYNRAIRDGYGPLSGVHRTNYIKQFISEDDSPQFFDTGFRGSIPEDIINRLELVGSMNERIHLLDVMNGFEDRRVKGLTRNAAGNVIESAPKSEESADMLTIDPQSGLIKYIAVPACLEDQFKFQIGRSVLMRHYWAKENARITNSLGEVSLSS